MLGLLTKSTGKADAYFQAKLENNLDAQCSIIASVNDNDNFLAATRDILTRAEPKLWHSLICNGFIRVLISKAQYTTSYNAIFQFIADSSGDPSQQSLWIVNCFLFYRQVAPIDYKNHFKQSPLYFPALYAYGVQVLQNHYLQSSNEARAEFSLWMDVLLSWSDQTVILDALRKNQHFNTFFAEYTRNLSAPLKLLALNVFPNKLDDVLCKIKTDLDAKKAGEVNRQARILLNLIFKTERYKATIQSDADFCSILGVTLIEQGGLPLQTQRTAPTPPTRYESSIAAHIAQPERPGNPVASVFDAEPTLTTAYNAFQIIDDDYRLQELKNLEARQWKNNKR